LLVNEYNVYWTPETMIFKHAIVQVASVAEAVLQYMVKLIEDDPRVQEVLGKECDAVDALMEDERTGLGAFSEVEIHSWEFGGRR
jgi:hypothetical protein